MKIDKRILEYGKELAKKTNRAKFSENMVKLVNFRANNKKYSFNNLMLILSQKKNATIVRGFQSWKKIDRYPLKDTAIDIISPIFNYETKELIGFTTRKVFDISDTKGKPLPKIEYLTNGNSQSKLYEKMIGILKEENIKLILKPLKKGLNGYTNGKEIVINKTLTTDDKFNTIIHEYLHYNKHFINIYEKIKDTKTKETEAEATAYILCRLLGIEPSKSYNYLALYNSDSKEILKSIGRIDSTIKHLFQKLEVK